LKTKNKKNIQIVVLKDIVYIAENKLIMKASSFFFEWVNLNGFTGDLNYGKR